MRTPPRPPGRLSLAEGGAARSPRSYLPGPAAIEDICEQRPRNPSVAMRCVVRRTPQESVDAWLPGGFWPTAGIIRGSIPREILSRYTVGPLKSVHCA